MACTLSRQLKRSTPGLTENILVQDVASPGTTSFQISIPGSTVLSFLAHYVTPFCAGRPSGATDRAESGRDHDGHGRYQRHYFWPVLAAGISVFSAAG